MVRIEGLRMVRGALEQARRQGIPMPAMMDALLLEAMPLLLEHHGPERAALFLEQMALLIRAETGKAA